jgi:uncharacterized membrane protein
MRNLALIALLALTGCGGGDAEDRSGAAGANVASANGAEPAATLPAAPPPASDAPATTPQGGRWNLQSSGEGSALILSGKDGTAIRLFCPAGANRLLVNVPAFKPIGSEERLSFGGGGDAVALVADSRGDGMRGGVSGTGAVPNNLAALVAGTVSASYGAQSSGPHPAPPAELARGFVAACADKKKPSPSPAPPPPPATGAASPCLMQGSERLDVKPARAVGTEPFWAARIEGRCVTYSHPEDQKGTRVWTRYAAGAGGGGTWSGTLSGKPFVLRLRPQPGCSDGMSDNRYPLAAELLVAGERRSGCARLN